MTALGIVAGIFVMFVVATFVSPAWPVGRAIAALKGKHVRIEVWGQPMTGTEIESALNLGVGVNVKVSGHPFKIAQPGDMTRTAGVIEIAYARYVQWDKKRVPHPPGTAAPAVRITTL